MIFKYLSILTIVFAYTIKIRTYIDESKTTTDIIIKGAIIAICTLIAIAIIIAIFYYTLLKIKSLFYKKTTQNQICYHNFKKKKILTKAETTFFHVLLNALPEYHIFTQVAFAAFITHNGNSNFSKRNHFDRKIADFVIANKQLEIIAIIELDDKSHNRKVSKDKQRDAILNEIGYHTIRYHCEFMPNVLQVKNDFENL